MNGSEEEPTPPEQERGLAELMAARRAKLERVRAEQKGGLPYSFPNASTAASLHERYAGLAAGEETSDAHRVAGRLVARRGQGGMAFLDLLDRSGQIQIQARADLLGEDAFERLTSLDLGDLLGVEGPVIRTRRGELSLRAQDFTLLAKALRPPPDKHHGLIDVETRHRQRELDLMANVETRQVFLTRAAVISAVREYLDREGFVEVETPVLQPLYGGALARPFVTHHNALDRDLYLRIATELYLKRLIVGGLDRVYELGKDFRNEGVSSTHNPEFTMVEWYEAYADYSDETRRLEEMVAGVAERVGYRGEIDFSIPWRRVTVREVIREATGIDFLADRDVNSLDAAIRERGLEIGAEGFTWFQLVDHLLSKYVEPTLVQPTFVLDYPIELSPFAREHRTEPGLAERWEAFVGGMEIANAFSELNDPDEQRRRFEAQQRLSTLGDEEAQPYDEAFLEALEHGMPPTGGVGLGIDRLAMVLTGRRSIREVVLFPALR